MPEDNVFEATPANKEEVVTKETVSQEEVDKLKERGLDSLAEGKAHADRFIDFLEEQNKGLKEELDKRVTAEASLEDMKKVAAEKAAETRETEVSEEPTSSGLKPEDIKALVAEEISEANKNKKVQGNIAVVDSRVKEVYGDKAVSFIEDKAKELGLTKTDLGNLAAQSPKAFFDMVGMSDITPSENIPAPTGTVNPEALANQSSDAVKPGTHKYYNDLRKKDPRNFYTPAIQQRLFKDRERLGEKFYE